MVVNVVVVAAAGDSFDDHAEQQEAIVAVRPAAAGLEFQAALAVELHIVLEGAQLSAMGIELRSEEIAGAAGVREQVMYGDLGSEVLVRVVGDILSQRIGELDLAGLHELENRH